MTTALKTRDLMRSARGAALLLLAAVAAVLSGCSMMDYHGPDCTTHRRVRFVYDWNMLYADAFASQVKTLTLYAFDADGQLVYTNYAATDSIISKGYMDVDDMPAGTYQLMVWAQGEDRYAGSYTFGTPGQGSDSRSGLTVTINSEQNTVDHDLTPLFYGTLDNADMTDMPTGGTREVTVPLMKDTNVFRIVLQNLNGTPLDAQSFDFRITDSNGSLDADNNLVSSPVLTYQAWSQYSGEAGISSDATGGSTITGVSAAIAELTTNRLIVGQDMRLHVTDATNGTEIINIPLIDIALLVKGNYNRSMSDQEYLDRQDTYDLIFFIGDDRTWLSASIYVNSWRVVLQDVEM